MISSIAAIPIFIISYNRLTVLKQSIKSYRQIIGHTIIVHDTGSTYPPLLDYLFELEQQDIEVYRNRPSILKPDDLNTVDETIQPWLARHPEVGYYVVTDPDVMLLGDCSDIFEFYKFILDNHDIPVVGPMLRIDDIPPHYPLQQRVIEGHTRQYWSKVPEYVCWNSAQVAYQRALIDTTFGMYSRRLPFRRRMLGVRTHKPYWARHLDWYIDPENIEEDQLLYLNESSDVSHWGGDWLRRKLEFGWSPP